MKDYYKILNVDKNADIITIKKKYKKKALKYHPDKNMNNENATKKFNLISEAGNTQLDDKNEYTVATDNIARPITNFEFEISLNEKKRRIDLLRPSYLQTFVNDLEDVVRYSRSSSYITGTLASTELNNLTS